MRPLRALDRHWFEPARVDDLAALRIVLVGAQLFLFLPALSEQLWLVGLEDALFRPIPALKIPMLLFGEWGARPDPLVVRAVWLAAVASGIAGMLGLYTRASLLTFAATNTLMVAHGYSYGEYHHPEGLLIIALWVLALGPSGAALSLDDLRTRVAGSLEFMRFHPRREATGVSAMARWPVRTIQWLLVLSYFSAGLSKLKAGGLDWFNGHTLAYYLLQDGVRWGSSLALPLAEHTAFLVVLSVGTVAFELAFALAVLVPALAWPFVLGGAMLHTGIYALQRAPFFQFVFLYLAFIEPLRRHAPFRLPRSARRWTVVYDGLCPRCIRAMVVLDYVDVTARTRAVDLEGEWDEARSLAPELSREAARHAMHVVGPDGAVSRGFEAFRVLTRSVPALWPLAPIFHLPPVRRVGPRLYDRMAARRQRVACTAAACAAAATGLRAAPERGGGVAVYHGDAGF